jgi:hypothetical protein
MKTLEMVRRMMVVMRTIVYQSVNSSPQRTQRAQRTATAYAPGW